MGDATVSSTKVVRPGLGERLRRAVRASGREAVAAFERTPLEVLLGACAAIGLSVAVEREAIATWVRLLVAVGIALPLTYAASALYVRGIVPAAVRWLVSGVAVVFGAVWGFLGPDAVPRAEVWRTWLVVLTCVAALLCVPLVGPGGGERRARVHAFGARLVARTAIVLVYAAVLWVGLDLALTAVIGLFELHLAMDKPVLHLTAALFVLLPPWAIAAGLPALVAPVAPWREERLRNLRRVGIFLLAPLVLVYLGIVYAYALRVLATGQVPSNLVSPVIIGAGLLIVTTALALEPAYAAEQASGLRLLIRASAPLLLPLVLFAIWAVAVRLGQYGWTEFRYLRLWLLVLLALYAGGAIYQVLRRRPAPLSWVPAVLGVALLLSAFGPASAPAVARHSQVGALRATLTRAHVAGAPSAAGAPVAVPSPDFRSAVDKVAYLRDHFGWAAVTEAVPWIGSWPARRADVLARRIGIVEGLGPAGPAAARVVDAGFDSRRGISGVPGGTLWFFEREAPRQPTSAQQPEGRNVPDRAPPGLTDEPAVSLGTSPARVLVARPRGDTLVAHLVPVLESLLARSAGRPERRFFDARSRKWRTAVVVDLQAGDVVRPLLAADGRPAGQVLLRQVFFESAPRAVPIGAKSAGQGVDLRVWYAAGAIVLQDRAAAGPTVNGRKE